MNQIRNIRLESAGHILNHILQHQANSNGIMVWNLCFYSHFVDIQFENFILYVLSRKQGIYCCDLCYEEPVLPHIIIQIH